MIQIHVEKTKHSSLYNTERLYNLASSFLNGRQDALRVGPYGILQNAPSSIFGRDIWKQTRASVRSTGKLSPVPDRSLRAHSFLHKRATQILDRWQFALSLFAEASIVYRPCTLLAKL